MLLAAASSREFILFRGPASRGRCCQQLLLQCHQQCSSTAQLRQQQTQQQQHHHHHHRHHHHHHHQQQQQQQHHRNQQQQQQWRPMCLQSAPALSSCAVRASVPLLATTSPFLAKGHCSLQYGVNQRLQALQLCDMHCLQALRASSLRLQQHRTGQLL